MLRENEGAEKIVASGNVKYYIAVEPERALAAMSLTSQVENG